MLARLFEEEVARQLTEAGFDYERETSIGGLRPDFIVSGPKGQLVVVEAKAWETGGGNTARAFEQVDRYKKATGVEHVFLVMPDVKKNFESRGVVGVGTLLSLLSTLFEAEERQRHTKPKLQSSDRIVFAAMPFSREYDDTFLVAMSYAARQVNAACKRVDWTEFSGDIVAEIRNLIQISCAVIVDLSEAKPNVLYEAGYAHALGRPTVHICSTPFSDLPFDVRNWNTLQYRLGQTSHLRNALTTSLRAALL